MLRILLPLSGRGILATSVFAFIAAWNEFMFGYVLINEDGRHMLNPRHHDLQRLAPDRSGALTAASVLAVVPVATGFVYLQRFPVEGLSSGAVKG